MTKVIIDEDWGGDAMQVAAVLLAHPDRITVQGVTAVFGNTNHAQTLKNAGNILHLLNAPYIPYFPGSERPSTLNEPMSDYAHGNNGVGNFILDNTWAHPEQTHATDHILNILRYEPSGTVTIIAAGPLTNIARAFVQDPRTMKRARLILIMGGCTEPIHAVDMAFRQGNRTPYAEFNFYMAPFDTRIVMKSGLPIILFPMNCTHQFTFTPEREKILRAALLEKKREAELIIGMIKAPAISDQLQFGSYPVMHDVHTALWLLHPENYEGQRGFVDITIGGEKNGHSSFRLDKTGHITVMNKIKNTDFLFNCIVHSICKNLLHKSPALSPSSHLSSVHTGGLSPN